MTNGPTDDELLAAIGRAFALAPASPSAPDIASLRRAVGADQTTRRLRPGSTPMWRRPVPIVLSAALGLGAVAAGTAAAAATGASLPAPVRSAIAAVGLHVGDEELASAKTDMRRLRAAFALGDRPLVASAARELRRCLVALDADDRARVEPMADELLRRADDLLTSPPPIAGAAPASPPAARAPAAARASDGDGDGDEVVPTTRQRVPATSAPHDGETPEAATTTVASGTDVRSGDGDTNDRATPTNAGSASDGGGRTSDVGASTSDVGASTSDVGASTSDVGGGTSDVGSGSTDGGRGSGDAGTSGG